MTTRLEAIQVEISQLEARDYAKLERWERARLASLRVECKQLTPVNSARNITNARALAALQCDTTSDAEFRAIFRQLADAVGSDSPGLRYMARKHNIEI